MRTTSAISTRPACMAASCGTRSRGGLHIGLLMHSLHPRGGVVHTLELAEALIDRGHTVTLLTAARPGDQLFRSTRAQLSIAPLGALPSDVVGMVDARMAALHQHLRQWPELAGVDVLHSQDSISANALARLQEEGGIRCFVRTVHHLDAFASPQLTAWQARGVRAAARVLCVSRMWRDILRHEWAIEAHQVSNGVNLARFRRDVPPPQVWRDAAICRSLGVQAQGPVWLAVGGVEARKNTVRLLHAFARARARCPQAQLVITGGASLLDHDAEVQSFLSALQAHGLGPDEHGHLGAPPVVVTGPLPDEALPALYRRADVLAMPSVKEGFGLAVLEALACGTPAIASRIPPFTEHLGADEVIWVDPLDVDDIARALLRSLDPAAVRPVLDQAEAVCARMSWQASAVQHERIYLSHCRHHLSRHHHA